MFEFSEGFITCRLLCFKSLNEIFYSPRTHMLRQKYTSSVTHNSGYFMFQECDCDIRGVQNNDMTCDIQTGQCSCTANVGGRQCDRCLAGYYRYPSCLPCSCDSRGTTDDICDQTSAHCLCKQNVEGPQCAQCKQGTFYLEERNSKGCTKCFCFGSTQQCHSSNFRRTPVSLSHL